MTTRPNARLVAWLKIVPPVAGVAAMLTGLLVLLGWASDTTSFKSLFSGLVPMNPMTALCFIFSGLALLRLRDEEAGWEIRPVPHVSAALVTLVGAVSLAGFFFNFSPGVDQWLFPAKLDADPSQPPNRIAPNTASGFLLIGLALLLLDRESRRGHRPAQFLTLSAGLIGLLAVTGYAYRVLVFTRVPSYIPMALNTALAFCVLTLGVLCARPDRGLMATVTGDSAGGLTARRLTVAAIVIPLVLGWLRLEGVRYRLVDATFGMSFLVVSNILVFLFVIWWNARSLDRMDEQRQSTEERLRNSEALYHSLVENLPQNIFRKDLEGRFTFANQRFCATLGKAREEIIGKTDADFYPPDLAEKYRANDRQVAAAGGIFETVEENRAAGGEKIHVQAIKTPVLDARGRTLGVQGVFWDITARLRAEQALIYERYLLHTLMDNFPDQIYFKDADSRFLRINKALAEKFGLASPNLAVGRSDLDFFAPEYARQTAADELAVMQSARPLVGKEEEEIRPDGRSTWVSTTKMPLRDAEGQVIGSFGISRDITERKRFVEQLQRNNEELARSETALRQTMADLNKSHEELKAAQIQLIQAEKMESVGTLAAGVAHEVKNPLATMMLGVDYLTKVLPTHDENLRLVLTEVREAIYRADAIIRGLLDFSASHHLIVEAADLNAIVEQSVMLVRHELLKHNVTLVRLLGENLPPVGADKNQMQQVFVNVFMNALHAMADGGTLTLRTFAKVLAEAGPEAGSRTAGRFWPGDEVVIAEVDDTGHGIPEVHLPKIFDPFFTTKPTGVGTGLGLPVTRKIIEMHDGAIDIKNLKEGGVRVSIMLKAQRRT